MPAEDEKSSWPSERQKTLNPAQAKALREQASKGGIRFEAFLPSSLAEWLLELVERGVFIDPKEAAFVMFGEMKDLYAHADLRQELLKRTLQSTMDDPRPGSTMDEVMERLEKRFSQPRPMPAQWQKITADEED